MTTALALNAGDTITSGGGLNINQDMTTAVSTFQSFEPIVQIQTIYTNVNNISGLGANATANAKANLYSALTNIGSGVTQGQWLIDHYPRSVAPQCSGNLQFYGNANLTPFSVSFSKTLYKQALLPFEFSGMATFANVFLNAYSHAEGVFDTVASVTLLRSQTYGDTGIGFSGPADLASGGLMSAAPVIINTVQNWGTMYDVENINSIGDPYVFGQNLLNQQLGSYGEWEANLILAGLDTTNLPAVPPSTTIVIQGSSSTAVNTFVGQVNLPSLANAISTTVVTGNSADVVLAIYANVTESNLSAIVTATGGYRPSSEITNLADYLDFKKAIPNTAQTQLKEFNVTTFTELGQFLNTKIGSGSYRSWNEVVTFLNKIEAPSYSNAQTRTSGTLVLRANVVDRILTDTGTGSGELGQPIMTDYLGSVAGIPHIDLLSNISFNYIPALTTSQVGSTVSTLLTAVNSYISNYQSWNEGAGLGTQPSIAPVQTAVTAVNSALNTIPSSGAFASAEAAFKASYTHLNKEVFLLQKAGVVFDQAATPSLTALGSGIASFASDKTRINTYTFFQNIISSDNNGDDIKNAIAENINVGHLVSQGISVNNDPDPNQAINQAAQQNLPLNTYLSRNK